jgi:DNA polymerase kappa
MAGFIARKLCPHLRIIPVNMKKYQTASSECMAYVSEYGTFRSGSVDEVYLDLTDYVIAKYNESLGEDPLQQPVTKDMKSYPKAVWTLAADVVSELRNKIKQNTRLTCSAGIAHNKMLAKVCSDLNKPDGQYLLDASDPLVVKDFLENIRVRKIGGIGQVTEQHLKSLGIETCKQLHEARGLIQLLFTPAQIEFFLRVSLGVSSNDVKENDGTKRKSLGSETTFSATTTKSILNKHLAELSAEVAAELKAENLKGRKVTLIIKWATFKSNDRSRRLPRPSNEEKLIRETVQSLLQQAQEKDPVTAIRLLGVRVSDFVDEDSTSESSSSMSPVKKRSKTSVKQKPITEFVTKTTSPSKMFPDELLKPISLSSRLHPDHDFICVYCLTEFSDEPSLEKHLNQKACPSLLPPEYNLPDSPVRIPCPVCDSVFPDLPSLNVHLDKCIK